MAMAKNIGMDSDDELATRAAWLYFVAGITQAEIGKKLGLSRIRINRLLAHAREQGLVQISVTGRIAECVALEEKLKGRFSLKDAVVVPTPPSQNQLPQVIGAAAGQYFGSRLRDGMSVGVGWGRTLRYSLQSVPRQTFKRLSVVSLIGGLTQASLVNPHETASHLADIVGAQCYYIAAPALADSESTRDILLNQPMVREVFERGSKVDLALLSVGDLTPANTIAQVGLITNDEAAGLAKAGAVGDILYNFIDADGNIVDHEVNRRIISANLSRLRRIPEKVLISGGREKYAALKASINTIAPTTLITDQFSAEYLLNEN